MNLYVRATEDIVRFEYVLKSARVIENPLYNYATQTRDIVSAQFASYANEILVQ